jgi:hypothetical protein
MLINDLLNEVNMSQSSIDDVLQSDFAKNITIGFEFEIIVPGLEDLHGHNTGSDQNYANMAFPVTDDWKKLVQKFFDNGNQPVYHIALTRELNKLESNFNNYKNQKLNRYLDSALGKKDIKTEISKLLNSKNRMLIANSFNTKDSNYDQAKSVVTNNFLNNKELFKEFIDSIYMSTMENFCNKFNMPFPYKNTYSHTLTLPDLVLNFIRNTRYKAEYSYEYHKLERTENTWIFEPDSSVSDPNIKGAGIELVSPPMPFKKGIRALDKVWNWTIKNNITTNENTGMHVGISLPNHNQKDIDYIKLVLFLGDKYILKKFGRENNAYANAFIDKLEKRAKRTLKIDTLLPIIKSGVNNLAKNAFFQSMKKTNDRYVTVNIKPNYIEFRSAGGNYLENKQLILNTIGRYINAIQLAVSPELEKKEYAKKLYKFLTDNEINTYDPIYAFYRYATGEIDKKEMKRIFRTIHILRQYGQNSEED